MSEKNIPEKVVVALTAEAMAFAEGSCDMPYFAALSVLTGDALDIDWNHVEEVTQRDMHGQAVAVLHSRPEFRMSFGRRVFYRSGMTSTGVHRAITLLCEDFSEREILSMGDYWIMAQQWVGELDLSKAKYMKFMRGVWERVNPANVPPEASVPTEPKRRRRNISFDL